MTTSTAPPEVSGSGEEDVPPSVAGVGDGPIKRYIRCCSVIVKLKIVILVKNIGG